jgi:hypothetical protein
MPTFIATENILPYSVLKLATGQGDYKVSIAVAETEFICGVTDGTLSSSSNTYHALAGEAVRLQSGKRVYLRTSTYINPTDSSLTYTAVTHGCPLFAFPNGNGNVIRYPWLNGNPPAVSNYQFVALQNINLVDFLLDRNDADLGYKSPDVQFIFPAYAVKSFDNYTT